MIGVDLFAGAGGMSLGAVQAGIRVALAVECDPHAVKTYTHNHPGTRVHAGTISTLRKIDITAGRLPTVLFGGPPCQGFSTSNQRTRSVENADNWLFQEFLRVVGLWHPDWVVFENVQGMVETEGGVFLRSIIRGLERQQYTCAWWVLNALDYGVPQRRRRLVVVGSRHGLKLGPPRGTSPKPVTVREAISDLPDLPNGASFTLLPYKKMSHYRYAKHMRGKLEASPNHFVTFSAPHILERYRHVPPGGNWEQIPPRLMVNYADRTRCHTGIYRRLTEDEPSVVIGNFRKNMLIHPSQNRGLSVREAARLQSFPDWYEFKGSIGFQQQQVGNAMPPLLATAVFRAIMSRS